MCVYGGDADLIVLSLITHEPNIIVIKELTDVEFKAKPSNAYHKNFKAMYISLLWEYLEMEFKHAFSECSVSFDVDWVIDDFCFFTLFSGNDFLPSLNGNFDA